MQFIPYGQQIPIGDVMNIPTIGTIGSDSYYNQYYNPQYIRQQQEQEQALLKREQDNQMKTWLKLIKCNNSYYNENISEKEIINQLNSQAQMNRQIAEDYEFMNNIHNISQRCYNNLIQQNATVQQEQYTETQYEQKSFYRWLHEDAQERLTEMLNDKMLRQQHDTSQLYNSDAYRQLLGTHENVYASLMPNVSVDDMEVGVSLSEKLRNERDIRRHMFIQSIMNNGGINNG